MNFNARQYTIDAGWDFTSVQMTAQHGVSDEDQRIIREMVGAEADEAIEALHAFCLLEQVKCEIIRGPVDSPKDAVRGSTGLRAAGVRFGYALLRGGRRGRPMSREEALAKLSPLQGGERLLCEAEVMAGVGGGEATADTILVWPA
jgi:hypothetical protein